MKKGLACRLALKKPFGDYPATSGSLRQRMASFPPYRGTAHFLSRNVTPAPKTLYRRGILLTAYWAEKMVSFSFDYLVSKYNFGNIRVK